MAEFFKDAPLQRLFDQIGCKKWSRSGLLAALRASPEAKPISDLKKAEDFDPVPQWAIATNSRIFLHIPKGWAHAWQESNSWRWAQLIVIDDKSAGIEHCLVCACGSSESGISPGPFTIEIDRDGKHMESADIFKPEDYSDESTELVHISADRAME